MPVDGPSYLVGRTDERVLTMFLSSTNYRCLWTGSKDLLASWSTSKSLRTIRFQPPKIGGYTLLDVRHKAIPSSPYNA